MVEIGSSGVENWMKILLGSPLRQECNCLVSLKIVLSIITLSLRRLVSV